jgi:hypothetical protein
MATVVKNFRIKSGLIVEGNTGTIGGQNILTETGGDSYILNLVGGATLVKSVGANLSVDGAGELSLDLAGIVEDVAGNRLYTDGSTLNVDVEGIYDDMITNGLATTTNVDNAISTASTDATNKANAALSDAQSFATNKANDAYDNAVSAAATDATNKANAAQSAAEGFATTAANNAQAAAEDYADNKINDASSASDKVWSAYKTSTEIGLAQAAAEQHADEAVAALVGLAPSTLDTIEELATALENNPDIIANLESVAAGKQDTLTAGNGIDITGDTISVAFDAGNGLAINGVNLTVDTNVIATKTYAEGVADDADASARGYADSLASNYDAAGAASTAELNANTYAEGLVNNLTDGSTSFTELNVAGYTRQVGSWAAAPTAGVEVRAYQYSAGWGSAEFLVRVMSNDSGHAHSQLSKILVTRDAQSNIAITEYGIVTTNGTMGDVTADVSGGNIRILVTPTHASSEVIISGTLLAYND